ncbi:MAG TPA: hypothetical protein VFO60_09775 [Candidatus Dormibacteraeota bacterium]|nr:hypothetical protein [Candidatus Dormibacteraeota bacterium]
MSDESPRSAHGNPPNQGSGEGIPAWWADLGRADLPDDPVAPAARTLSAGTAIRVPQRRERPAPAARRVRQAPFEPHPADEGGPMHAPGRPRLANTLTAVIIVLAAVLATWVGLGDASARGLVVVALVFGVPTVLTMLAVSLVVRRGGR